MNNRTDNTNSEDIKVITDLQKSNSSTTKKVFKGFLVISLICAIFVLVLNLSKVTNNLKEPLGGWVDGADENSMIFDSDLHYQELNPLCLLPSFDFFYFTGKEGGTELEPIKTYNSQLTLKGCGENLSTLYTITAETKEQFPPLYEYRLDNEDLMPFHIGYSVIAKNKDLHEYISSIKIWTNEQEYFSENLVKQIFDAQQNIISRNEIITGAGCLGGYSAFVFVDGMVKGEIELTPNMLVNIGRNSHITFEILQNSKEQTSSYLNSSVDCYAKMDLAFNPETLEIDQNQVEFFFDDNEVLVIPDDVISGGSSNIQACFDKYLKESLLKTEYNNFTLDDLSTFSKTLSEKCEK